MELEQKIMDLGFKSVDIEFTPKNELEEDDDFCFWIRIYFYFKWNNSIDKLEHTGWREFESNSEEDLLKQLKEFVLVKDKRNYTLCLKSK